MDNYSRGELIGPQRRLGAGALERELCRCVDIEPLQSIYIKIVSTSEESVALGPR